MLESFVIFFVIVAVFVGIGLFLDAGGGEALWTAIKFLFGLGLVIGGIVLLVKEGGAMGAFGIFLSLMGWAVCANAKERG